MVEGFLGRDDRKTTAYPGIREDFEGGSDDKSTRQTKFGKKSIKNVARLLSARTSQSVLSEVAFRIDVEVKAIKAFKCTTDS